MQDNPTLGDRVSRGTRWFKSKFGIGSDEGRGGGDGGQDGTSGREAYVIDADFKEVEEVEPSKVEGEEKAKGKED